MWYTNFAITHCFSGPYCEAEINECAWFPCLNGGTCQDDRASFLCICPAKYTGSKCEREVNACDSSPCLNQVSVNIDLIFIIVT